MNVIKCDGCKKTLIRFDRVIIASAVEYEIGQDGHVDKEGISLHILIGQHFCSTKCLKDSIK